MADRILTEYIDSRLRQIDQRQLTSTGITHYADEFTEEYKRMTPEQRREKMSVIMFR